MARKSPTKDTPAITPIESENEHNVSAEATSDSSHSAYSSCGGVLKLAREKLGLSVHDVSTSLRLSDKQIEAIEADHFHLLPQPSIVRGFIRNYAKTVKVDSAPIVAAYNALTPDATPQSFTVKSNTTSRSVIGESKVSFSPTLFIGLMLAFALIAALFYYYTEHIKPNSAKQSTDLDINKVELNGDVTPNSATADFALPAAERLQEATPNESTEASTATNATAITLPTGDTTSPQATIAALTPATVPPTENTPVATPQLQADTSIADKKPTNTAITEPANTLIGDVSGDNSKLKTLSFSATEETWINIVNSRGKQIYSKVLYGGQSETLQAAPPLKITVGNAKSTTLNLDGQEVNLASHARNKVARFTVD